MDPSVSNSKNIQAEREDTAEKGPPYSQDILPEAPLPFGLIEEIVEVAAEGDENKPEGQEAENPCKEKRWVVDKYVF